MTTLINLALVSVFFTLLFHGMLERQIRAEIKNAALSAAAAVNASGADNFTEFMQSGNLRYTLIDADGRVVFDNFYEISEMDNHADRSEIIEAAQNGSGVSKRFSGTLREQTYYFAVMLNDSTYLRTAKTAGSLYDLLMLILPVAVVTMAVFAAVNGSLSKRLTEKILKPLNEMDLKSPKTSAYDELGAFIRMIKEQHERIEEQAAETESNAATVRAIFDGMREGLVLLSWSGKIVSANKSAMKLFNADENCIGKDAVYLSRSIRFIEMVKEARSGKAGNATIEFGETVWQFFFSQLNDGGIIIMMAEITDSVRAEKMRREFTANVSHELKTPLTNISGYAEIIESGMGNPGDTANFAGKIRREAAAMTRLVENILHLSKLDETENGISFEKTDIYAAAAEAVEAAKPLAVKEGVDLFLTGGHCTCKANKTLIQDLVFNLVENGIKYNKSGGSVTVTVSEKNGEVFIGVKDTGVGINETDLPRISERFYRADKSRSKKTGGTGLGLSIVKQIVRHHNGSIEIESRVNEGTSISVKIPL
ncbi:MAG: ATP-binding protein [Defluviitaleaceae bacterium]|nr:ATP-binding protein [Defluviitaleaceae bacterium]